MRARLGASLSAPFSCNDATKSQLRVMRRQSLLGGPPWRPVQWRHRRGLARLPRVRRGLMQEAPQCPLRRQKNPRYWQQKTVAGLVLFRKHLPAGVPGVRYPRRCNAWRTRWLAGSAEGPWTRYWRMVANWGHAHPNGRQRRCCTYPAALEYACRQVQQGGDSAAAQVADTWADEALCEAADRRGWAWHGWMSRCLWLQQARCG